MALGILKRNIIGEADLRRFVHRIEPDLTRFGPNRVLFLEEGGRALGEILSAVLNIPATGIDVSYPLSRFLNNARSPIRRLAWPIKEMIYKLSNPRLVRNLDPVPGPEKSRFLLVDDSASTGRSLRVVLTGLTALGIDRENIRVIVFRCGRNASKLVDDFETDAPVLFGER